MQYSFFITRAQAWHRGLSKEHVKIIEKIQEHALWIVEPDYE